MPSGTTRVAGVIGHPVAHSRSPAIHNAAFAARGLDWTFVAFDVAPGRAAAAVGAMRTLGLGGLSVTMPHKDTVLAAVDRVSPAADALGAANCLAWDGPSVVAHNTDGEGFVRALRSEGVDPAGRRVVLLGAGGAARAVAAALGSAGVASLTVLNRSADRGAAAAALAGPGAASSTPDELPGLLCDTDLVVNATPVGMGDAAASPVPAGLWSSGSVPEGLVVCDLVYHPLHTRLLRDAAAAGLRTVDGLGMLVHQAAIAFELWTGLDAPVEAMATAARSDVS